MTNNQVRKRLAVRHWRQILLDAEKRGLSPMEVATRTQKKLSSVLNAEKRCDIYLPRKKPKRIFTRAEWTARLMVAKEQALSAPELARRLGVDTNLVYAAERRYKIHFGFLHITQSLYHSNQPSGRAVSLDTRKFQPVFSQFISKNLFKPPYSFTNTRRRQLFGSDFKD